MNTLANYSHALKKNWYWSVIAGAIMLIGGIIALMNPVAASLGVELITGWTFIFAGIISLVQAFSKDGSGSMAWMLLLAILSILLGWGLLANPLAGMLSLTIVIGSLILINGAVKIAYGWNLRPIQGWVWVMISGIISIVLAIFIFAKFPATAAITLGTLVAIDLIISGISLILLGFQFKKLPVA